MVHADVFKDNPVHHGILSPALRVLMRSPLSVCRNMQSLTVRFFTPPAISLPMVTEPWPSLIQHLRMDMSFDGRL